MPSTELSPRVRGSANDVASRSARDLAAAPTLAVLPLRSLLRADGAILATLPIVLVSPFRQMRLQSGFGCLASGPLAALHLPGDFRLMPLATDDVQHAYALSFSFADQAGAARGRDDLIPSRIAIGAATFRALLSIVRRAPSVLPGSGHGGVRRIVHWLQQDAGERGTRCHGRQVSRLALRHSSDRITQAEDDLMALAAPQNYRDFRLPGTLQQAASVRRFLRVTGYGPRHYLREWHARRVLIAQRAGRPDRGAATVHMRDAAVGLRDRRESPAASR
jgi:hypothetical protein